MEKGFIRRIFLKEWMFILVLIVIFFNVYIKKIGIIYIFFFKLLFILIIFIVVYFIDKKFVKYVS